MELKKMKIGIIGNGNIAHFFATSLKAASCPIQYNYSRSQEKGKHFAHRFDTIFMHDMTQFFECCDLILLAVSDDAIVDVASSLPAHDTHKIIVHTSGSLGADVLKPFATHYGVIWPIYSIVKNHLPTDRNVPIYITASDAVTITKLEQISAEFSNWIKTGNDQEKEKMHLLAVCSNNFINHLLAVSQSYAMHHNIDFDWIKPIIQQSVMRIKDHHDIQALQTGPAIRKDQTTIDRHLQLLQQDAIFYRLYKHLTQSIIDFHHTENHEIKRS